MTDLMIYSPAEKLFGQSKNLEPFYCGEDFNHPDSLYVTTLWRYKTGDLTLQEAFDRLKSVEEI